jgi:hypothetical protein
MSHPEEWRMEEFFSMSFFKSSHHDKNKFFSRILGSPKKMSVEGNDSKKLCASSRSWLHVESRGRRAKAGQNDKLSGFQTK